MRRKGFTLIEVLVAMVVLTMISAGLLATTWRLVAFARDEAEHLIADAYCHDVLWAVYSQPFTNTLAGVERKDGVRTLSWQIDPTKALPSITRVDLFGQTQTLYPLWRSGDTLKYPSCRVIAEGDDAASEKTLTVQVAWYNGQGELVTHEKTVSRANMERRPE